MKNDPENQNQKVQINNIQYETINNSTPVPTLKKLVSSNQVFQSIQMTS